MALTETDIQKAIEIEAANKEEAQRLLSLLDTGEPLSPEDTQFIETIQQLAKDKKTAGLLMQKANRTPEEEAFLDQFEAKIVTPARKEQEVDPRSGVPRVVDVPAEKALFAKSNLPEDIKADLRRGLAEIAPIADLQLENGQTVLATYLKKKLGDGNVLASKDNERFFIRPGEGQRFEQLPKRSELPDFIRGATTFTTGALGEAAGLMGGGFLGALGGAAGSAIGEGFNISNAINFAKKEGIVIGDEPALQKKLIKEALISGAIGGVFGGGAGPVRGVGRGVKTAIEEGAPLGKSISEGLRAESKTVSQQIANQARSLGLRGKDISTLKGEVEQQGTVDYLKKLFSEIPDEPITGQISQKALQSRLVTLNAEKEALFAAADANFAANLEKGTFGFIDMTSTYARLVKEIEKASLKNPDIARVVARENILTDLQAVLNSTKKQVISGEIPVSDVSKKRFVKQATVTKQIPTGTIDPITGRPGTKQIQENVLIGEAFDPKQATASDLRSASNLINEKLNQLDGKEMLAPKMLKRLLVQFKGGLDSAFQPAGSLMGKNNPLEDTALAFLDDQDDILAVLSAQNPFFGTIKTPGRSMEIQKYKDAYAFSKKIHQEIPTKLKVAVLGKSIKGQLRPAEVEDTLFNMDSDLAGKLKNIIDKDPKSKRVFELGMQKRIFEGSSRQSERIANVSPEAFAQAQIASDKEILEAQTKGIKPTLNLIDESTIPLHQRTRELEQGFSGSKVKQDVDQNRTTRVLLGQDKTKETIEISSRLGAAQSDAGKKASLFDTGIGSGASQPSETSGGIGGAIGALAGGAIGNKLGEPFAGAFIGQQVGSAGQKQLARAVRPTLRFTADALETARTVPLAPVKDVLAPFFEPNRNLSPQEEEDLLRQQGQTRGLGDNPSIGRRLLLQ